MAYLVNTLRTRRIGAQMPVSLIEDDRSSLLRGTLNALLLVSPFWAGLIYWLTR